jgi:hypothetical protein
MEFVRSRLREDLDPSVAERVVLRGERVGIDSDFADRFLRGKLATRKAVYEELAAVGAGGRPRERLEIGGKVVRVVRKGLQIIATKHQRTCVARWISTDGSSSIVPNRDLL